MKVRVYGDLHGDFSFLDKTIKSLDGLGIDEVWIAGDFGYGFPGTFDQPIETPKIRIRFIRGNHDNPNIRIYFDWDHKGFFYIPDGMIHHDTLFIGGAWSIDWQQRTPGMNWWDQEQLSMGEMDMIEEKVRRYEGAINTVITHEAPYELYKHLHPMHAFPNRTAEFLEHLRKNVLVGPKKPSLWLFGHHHKRLNVNVDGTQFICLHVMQTGHYVDLEFPEESTNTSHSTAK